MQHRYNKSRFALLLVPSNHPEVNQRIIDISIHIIKSNCATYVHLSQLNKTASTINTLQVHAKGNKLNHNALMATAM